MCRARSGAVQIAVNAQFSEVMQRTAGRLGAAAERQRPMAKLEGASNFAFAMSSDEKCLIRQPVTRFQAMPRLSRKLERSRLA